MKNLKNLLALVCLLWLPTVAAAQSPVPFGDIVLTSRGTPAGGAFVSVCSNPGFATTSAQVTSNIAILGFSTSPITAGFVANMSLTVSGFTGADTYFNGSFTVLTVTSTQVTYQLVHANASASSNGFAFQTGTTSQACAPLSSIFSDAAGLVPITQPGFTADGLGNVSFYAASGNYNVQYYGPVLTVRVKPVNLPCAGTCSFQNLNGVLGVGSGITDLPTALGQCLASVPCDIDLAGASSNFTAAQSYSNAQTLRIRGRGDDINGNNNGTVLTYTPGSTGTSAIAVNTSKPFSMRSLNFSQGNANASTNGVVLNGNQGALFDSVQLAGFTGNGLSINDSATSSGGPNLFLNMQTVLNGTGIKINSTNAGKASNTNVFVGLNDVLNTGLQFSTLGNSSDTHIFGAFFSSNSSPVVQLGDNTNSCRGGALMGVSIESGASPVSNQVGLQNNCAGLFAMGEFAPVSGGTPVPIQDGGIAGACHWLFQTSGVVAAGVHWESTCKPLAFNSFGAMALGSGCNPVGSVPGINFCANSTNSLSSAGVVGLTINNTFPYLQTGPTQNLVVSTPGATSQKTETSSADANVLTVTPAATVGTYRACFNVSVSSATAGVIAWTLSYKNSNGVAQTNDTMPLFQQGTAAPNTTFTTSAAGEYQGCWQFDVDNSATAIVVKWVGGGTTAAKVSATVERII